MRSTRGYYPEVEQGFRAVTGRIRPMPTSGPSFLRKNAFLVAAVALPVAVVALFLAFSVVPRWLVPPPTYDLLFGAGGPYDQVRPRIAVDYKVRDGRVEAVVQALPANSYPQISSLFLFDHLTAEVREIPFDLATDLSEGDPPRTITIDALPGRHVLAQSKAPDGYELDTRSTRGPGLIGDLFGMNGYQQFASLVKSGRSVRIALPSPHRYHMPI